MGNCKKFSGLFLLFCLFKIYILIFFKISLLNFIEVFLLFLFIENRLIFSYNTSQPRFPSLQSCVLSLCSISVSSSERAGIQEMTAILDKAVHIRQDKKLSWLDNVTQQEKRGSRTRQMSQRHTNSYWQKSHKTTKLTAIAIRKPVFDPCMHLLLLSLSPC